MGGDSNDDKEFNEATEYMLNLDFTQMNDEQQNCYFNIDSNLDVIDQAKEAKKCMGEEIVRSNGQERFAFVSLIMQAPKIVNEIQVMLPKIIEIKDTIVQEVNKHKTVKKNIEEHAKKISKPFEIMIYMTAADTQNKEIVKNFQVMIAEENEKNHDE